MTASKVRFLLAAGYFRPWKYCRDWPGIITKHRLPLLYDAKRAVLGSYCNGLCKNENRLGTFACISSIGPVQPIWSLVQLVHDQPFTSVDYPGGYLAHRNVAPVLQQLESASTQDISVNDCFKRFQNTGTGSTGQNNWLLLCLKWCAYSLRLLIQEQLPLSATGCSGWSFRFSGGVISQKSVEIARPRPDSSLLKEAASLIKASKKPVIVSGGGVIYSEATGILRQLVERTRIPVTETFAGKGALPYNHPSNLGAVGATGTQAQMKLPE